MTGTGYSKYKGLDAQTYFLSWAERLISFDEVKGDFATYCMQESASANDSGEEYPDILQHVHQTYSRTSRG